MASSSIGDILARDTSALGRRVTVRLPLITQEMRDEHADLDKRLLEFDDDPHRGIDDPPERTAIADRLLELEAEMEESHAEIVVRSLGHKRWADLLRDHPPSKEHRRADSRVDHNPETFPPAAIAASTDSTIEEVGELLGQEWFDEVCYAKLWGATLEANIGSAVPKSLAAGRIRRLNER